MTPPKHDVVLFTSFPPPFGGPSVWGSRISASLCAAGIRTVAVSWIGEAPKTTRLEQVPVDAVPPPLSANTLYHLARELPRVTRDLCRLGFFGSARDLRYGQLMEVIVAAIRFPGLLRALDDLCLRSPILIVNGAHYWPALLGVLARRHIPGSKLIIRAKGIEIDRIGAASPNGVRFLLSRADLVVVASEHLRRMIVQHVGVPRRSVKRIPNPVDLPDLLDLPAKEANVLFVGVLEPHKDPETYVRAAAEVARRVPAARFTIIGEGPLRAELEQLSMALDIHDRVRFAGRLDNAQVLTEMTEASVLVLPSRREAFGIALIEALASYTPCVVTEVGGMSEIITPREGFVVAPGDVAGIADAVTILLEDDCLRGEMGRRGRDRAERLYSTPVVMRQWAELLK